MSIVTYNNRSIANISAIPGAAESLTLIKTLTASSDSTLSFVDGSDDVVLDSTYPIYIVRYINLHPSANGSYFQVNFRDGGSAYDATKTTTMFSARHTENDATAELSYRSGNDLAQGTGVQYVDGHGIANDNDNAISGILHLFNPASTTFVKHFLIRSTTGTNADDNFVAGYCNTTAAIDGIQFSYQSGNIDTGTIKLYGLKDS